MAEYQGVEELSSLLSSNDRDVARLRQKLSETDLSIEQHRNEFKSHQEEQQLLEKDLNTFHSNISNITSDLDATEFLIFQLEADSASHKSSDNITTKNNTMMETLDSNQKHLLSHIERYEATVAAMSTSLNELPSIDDHILRNREMKVKASIFSDLRNEKEQIITESKRLKSEIVDIQTKINTFTAQREAEQEIIDKCEEEKKMIDVELTEEFRKTDLNTEEYSKANASIESLKCSNAAMDIELQEMKAKLLTEKTQSNIDMDLLHRRNVELSTIDDESAKIVQLIKEEESLMETLKEEVSNLESDVSSKSNVLEHIIEQRSTISKEIEREKERLENANKNFDEFAETCTSIQTSVSDTTAELESMTGEIEAMDTLLQDRDLEANSPFINKEFEAAKCAVNEKEETLKEMSKKQKQVEDANAILKGKIDAEQEKVRLSTEGLQQSQHRQQLLDETVHKVSSMTFGELYEKYKSRLPHGPFDDLLLSESLIRDKSVMSTVGKDKFVNLFHAHHSNYESLYEQNENIQVEIKRLQTDIDTLHQRSIDDAQEFLGKAEQYLTNSFKKKLDACFQKKLEDISKEVTVADASFRKEGAKMQKNFKQQKEVLITKRDQWRQILAQKQKQQRSQSSQRESYAKQRRSKVKSSKTKSASVAKPASIKAISASKIKPPPRSETLKRKFGKH
jgi:chromosome segregation ATPase